ncbi:MAG: ATP-binding protein [Streptosporangiaceae bacterium]|jgi:anti-sigma regulatory factor (Ser/Thr protein kinase)
MAALVASDVTEELAMMAGAAVLGSLTISGRPEHVSEARAFVAKIIGDQSPVIDVAVLLTSEIVTNAVKHSNSRRVGGTVRLVMIEIGDGIRVEVADDGSDLSAPVVKGDLYASDGHGLFLVQSLAHQWGYVRQEGCTTVWFWLGPAPSCTSAAPGPVPLAAG